MAARAGILVKDRLALERMRLVDTVLFDKTGTLTEGRHVVNGVVAIDDLGPGEALRLAAAVEFDSEHPLAKAIVTAARAAGAIPRASAFRAITGRGVEATVEGVAYAVGGPALLGELQLTVADDLVDEIDDWKRRGAAVLHLVRDDAVIAAFALEDAVRQASREAVDELQALGSTWR